MKSFDEILEYLNKHDDRVDYQIYLDRLDGSIQVQFPQGASLFIDVKRHRISFSFNKSHLLSVTRMEQSPQHLQQAVELKQYLEEFLQSP